MTLDTRESILPYLFLLGRQAKRGGEGRRGEGLDKSPEVG